MPEQNQEIRNSDFDVSYYFVGEDRELSDGKRLLQCPLSPKYGTPEQAEAALDELAATHPGASIYCATLFCLDAEQRDAALASIQ